MIAAVAVTVTPKRKVKSAVAPKAVAARRNKQLAAIGSEAGTCSLLSEQDVPLQKVSTYIAEIFGEVWTA